MFIWAFNLLVFCSISLIRWTQLSALALPRKFLVTKHDNKQMISKHLFRLMSLIVRSFCLEITDESAAHKNFSFFSFSHWDHGMLPKYIENMPHPYLDPSQIASSNQALYVAGKNYLILINQLFINDVMFSDCYHFTLQPISFHQMSLFSSTVPKTQKVGVLGVTTLLSQ